MIFFSLFKKNCLRNQMRLKIYLCLTVNGEITSFWSNLSHPHVSFLLKYTIPFSTFFEVKESYNHTTVILTLKTGFLSFMKRKEILIYLWLMEENRLKFYNTSFILNTFEYCCYETKSYLNLEVKYLTNIGSKQWNQVKIFWLCFALR